MPLPHTPHISTGKSNSDTTPTQHSRDSLFWTFLACKIWGCFHSLKNLGGQS